MSKSQLIPIYISSGEIGGYLVYPYLYNRLGEWIGCVARNKDVYSVHGRYVGFIAQGPRILSKRNPEPNKGVVSFPIPQKKRIQVPPMGPLAPLLPEISFAEIDVLEDRPELLPTIDMGELREDMD